MENERLTNAIAEGADFRTFLQQSLIQRCKANPRYSLRAFARSLGVDSSYVSKLLNGKRNVSWKVIRRLGPHLDLDPSQMEKFRGVKGKAADEPANSFDKSSSAVLKTDYVQLSYDAFQLVADWYHYAILELLTVENFVANPKWIAATLGIKVPEVNDALERMCRLGMLQKTVSGKYRLTPESHTTVGTPYTAAALKKLQRQVLMMAIEALDETPIEERDQSAMTMAIDSRLLPEAKIRVKNFRRELCAFLQEGRKRDRVYHLSVSIYPVSKRPKSHRKVRKV